MDNERNRIKELLWYELVHAKYWEQYISRYISHKIDWRKRFNIATVILSIVGASTWKLWAVPGIGAWASTIIFCLVALLQILSAVQKDIVVDNSTLQSLIKLRTMYIAYFNKLERLFIDVENKNLSPVDIENQYFSLRETVYPIEELKDSLNIRELRDVKKGGEKEATKYLNSRYCVV
ncbi:hypothetical protein [Parabacteroides pacaensis]|uniref:hypothetical protein n=1 Tax=Parabacteroides pacaensis TaxID=2086575 RepID=UPI000D0EF554|nr:hypothetical protein [Parabacteroides pacaensis]